jgi:hypothetical protein
VAGCRIPSPEAGLPCARQEHSSAVAHHARGRSADGTQWAMFWWDPEQVAGHERPPTGNDIPRPRPAAD